MNVIRQNDELVCFVLVVYRRSYICFNAYFKEGFV